MPSPSIQKSSSAHLRVVAVLAVLAASLFLTGCAVTGKNVLYANAMQSVPKSSQSGDLVYIFIDREGDLYPPVCIRGKNDAHQPSSCVDMSDELMLKTCKGDQCEKVATLRRYFHNTIEGKNQLDALYQLTGTHSTSHLGSRWEEVQSVLRKRAADQIRMMVESKPDARLVVLVHGYNNDYSEAEQWYDEISENIRRREPNVVFVRVHWDGLEQGFPIGIWGKA